MLISTRGRKLLEMMAVFDGKVVIHKQEVQKAVDVRELIDSGLAKVSEEGVVSPGVSLELTLPTEEVELLNDIYCSVRGVAVAGARDKVRLSRIKTLIEMGLIQVFKCDGIAYLFSV